MQHLEGRLSTFSLSNSSIALATAGLLFLSDFSSATGPCLAQGPGPIDDKAIAILRGVAESRSGLKRGRMKLIVSVKAPTGTDNSNQYTVLFEGSRRRFDNESSLRGVMGKGSKAAFDGSRVVQFNGQRDVNLRQIDDSTGEVLFDPRILGITTSYYSGYAINQCLGIDNPRAARIIAEESIENRKVTHIQLIDAYERHFEFWVSEGPEFQVVRCLRKSSGSKRTITTQSSYVPDVFRGLLPTRVVTTENGPDGLPRLEYVMQVQSAEEPAAIDSKQWTLEGINPPIGTNVLDLRIKEQVGYWDGTRIVKDLGSVPPAMPPSKEELKNKDFRTWLVVANLIGVAVAGVSLWYWKRSRRLSGNNDPTPPSGSA